MDIYIDIKKHVSKHALFYIVVVMTLFFGLCAHAYRFFNLDYHHDALLIFEGTDVKWQLSLGRFLQPLYWYIRGDLCAPWLLGLLALLWLALGNYLVICLLHIRSVGFSILLCGILSTNATLSLSTATYIPWLDVYALAYLLAVLSACLTEQYRYGYVLAWIPLVLSLGLYQCYVNVTVILLMIVFVRHILDGLEVKKLFCFIGKYLAALLGGLVSYYLVLQVMEHGLCVALSNSEHGVARLWNGTDTYIPLVRLVYETYKLPIWYMLNMQTHLPNVTGVINVAFFVISFGVLLHIAIMKKLTKFPFLLLICTVALMPFGINLTYFIANAISTNLIYYSFFFFYAFAVVLLDYEIYYLDMISYDFASKRDIRYTKIYKNI